jgi:hypothetical protein
MADKDRDSILKKLDERAGIHTNSSQRSLYGGNAPSGAVPDKQAAMRKANNFLEGFFAFLLDMTEEVFGVKLQRSRKKQGNKKRKLIGGFL